MKRLLNDGINPYFNLALEEYFLRESDEDIFMLWKDEPSVVCGRNQNIFAEVDVTEAEDRGIHLCRRYSGGGTVYHAGGNINYTIITSYGGELEYGEFISPVVKALNSFGVPARLSGNSDIFIGEYKISGNAQARVGGRLLHHGTLLFDTDLSVLNSVAGVGRAYSDSLSSKSVKSRVAEVGNIRDFLDVSVEEFEKLLGDTLCLNMEDRAVTDLEKCEITKLSEEKYSSWEWIFGYSPRFEFDDGEIKFTSKNGKITETSGGLPPSLVGARLERRELISLGLDDATARYIINARKTGS